MNASQPRDSALLVSLIVAAEGPWESTHRCLMALLEERAEIACETIVVDDGSTDATRAALPRLHGLRVLRSDLKQGRARAFNTGAAAASGRYLAFLSGTVEPRPGWLAPVLTLLDGHDDIGIASARLVSPDGAITCGGYALAGPSLLVRPIQLGDRDDDPLEVLAVSNSAMVVRAELFRALGGFDEQFTDLHGDIDLCLRARTAGKKVFVATASSVVRRHQLAPPGEERGAALLRRRWSGRVPLLNAEDEVERERSSQGKAKVAVVIPCYRQAPLLSEAVSSVAMQTFADWECVVVDDGSPDETAAVARSLVERLPGRRLRLVRQANAGLAAARNVGISATAAPYVLPLDADDLLDPAFLERTVIALETHPETAIATTDASTFGAFSTVWDMDKPFDVASLRRENQLNYCSLYRREVFEAVGGYNPNMEHGYEDWDFWLGAAERGFRKVHLAEVLFYYRVKPNSMVTEAMKHDAQLRARLALNHPASFDARERLQAEAVLAVQPTRRPRSAL